MSPAAELVAIRVAYVVLVVVSVLWLPGHVGLHGWGSFGDLVFGPFARWDAGWFVAIARHGYQNTQSAAFFPLYPLVVRAVAFVLRSEVASGVLVSLASAAGAATMLARLPRGRAAVTLLALYPLAFVFTAPYSDALFLLLAIASFDAARRGRSVAAGVLGGLAVASRLLGVALLPALAVLLWRRGPKHLAPLLLLPAALGAYMLYLHEHFGDWLEFAHAEGAYWLRHTPPLGPLQGLFDAFRSGEQGLAQLVLHLPGGHYGKPEQFAIWNVVFLALLLVAVWLTWEAWRRLGAAYGVYSAATLLIVLSSPADVVPLVSLPRFLLADFPLFLALAAVLADRPRARRIVVDAFAAVGAVAAVAFARGSWVP
ncbi:MAG TPA: mannosyltransferase family protein [Gaiellaceae bacterium]|nr:mannosyltransferase family protein [Gaiellaceae bacterium]